MPQPESKARRRTSLGLVVCASLVVAIHLVESPGRTWLGRKTTASEPLFVQATAFQQVQAREGEDERAEGLSLNGGTDWINSGPIRLEELRGKLVLLDFWTFCCINCHHILPDLAKLEEKYKNELVVIGVHSPKFAAERDTENIRNKVNEYQIKHPVVNDPDRIIQDRFGVSIWPTLVLIDVDGTLIGKDTGEGKYSLFDREIGKRVAKHKTDGKLNTTPLQFFPESDQASDSPLRYPGKVLADEATKSLYIADTAHNRIVRTDLDGKQAVVVGMGLPGLVDGDFKKAQFNRPQGMCLVDGLLYVADTESHAIRKVDFKSKRVTTVAGTGEQSYRRSGTGRGTKTSLSSPWDVVLIPGTKTLAIAMAGIHQIWRYDIPSDTVTAWAGTGVENIQDGPIASALFSQPSGLATDGKALFVADSEASAIREVILDRHKSRVRTIVGLGLFLFDDVDGVGDEVRLQHALGVAYGKGNLYVADTYNNKIKVCDPVTRRVETLVGSKQPGRSNNPPQFYQPGGLSVAGNKLYVADSNNGLIRVVDLTDKTVETLEFEGLQPPVKPRPKPSFPLAQALKVPRANVGPGRSVTLQVAVPVEEGYKLSKEVAMPYLLETPGKTDILTPAAAEGHKVDPPSRTFKISVPLARSLKPGESFPLKLSVGSFVCGENSSLCKVKSYTWTIPVTVTAGGNNQIKVDTIKDETVPAKASGAE